MLRQIYTPTRTKFRICDSVTTPEGVSTPIVEGQLSDVDIVTPNGYRYKNGFWDHVLSQPYVKDMIYNHECLGTIEHPEDDSEYLKTPYEKASHLVLSVTVENGRPFGRFALLNNPKGNAIKALIELSVPIGVSTRGLGDTLSDEISDFIDPNNYALITWDFTNQPNIDVHMRPVSDSIRSNPLFREYVALHQIIDSSFTSPLGVHSDFKKLFSELKLIVSKIEQSL